MKKSFGALGAGLLLAASAVQAVEVRPLIGLGLTFGGDKLAGGSATVVGTGASTSLEVHGGGMFALVGGLELGFTDLWSAQLNASYHFDKATAEDGEFSFERFPIELLGHYRVSDTVRLGGGLRFAGDAKLRVTGQARRFASNVDYKASTGVVLEGEYLPVGARLGWKLRVVSEKYKPTTPANAQSKDGTHIGGYMTYYFK